MKWALTPNRASRDPNDLTNYGQRGQVLFINLRNEGIILILPIRISGFNRMVALNIFRYTRDSVIKRAISP
jgi:hypothetical protein